MVFFKRILAASLLCVSVSAFADETLGDCESIKGKKAKIETLHYGKHSPLGFSFSASIVSDDGKGSVTSKIIPLARKAKSSGGAAALNLLVSAVNNNYIVVVDRCLGNTVASFHIETNSIMHKG